MNLVKQSEQVVPAQLSKISHSSERLVREDSIDSNYLLTRNQVRAGRVLAGLGIRDLAAISGLSPGAISQIETGRTEQAHESTLRTLRTALEKQGVEFAAEGWVRNRHDTELIRSRTQEDSLAKTIATSSKRARKNLGMTVDEVAEGIGVSVEMYSRIELGLVMPSVPTLIRMAKYLSLSLDQLLYEARPLPALPVLADGTRLDETRAYQILRLLESVKPSGVRILTVLLKEIIDMQDSENDLDSPA